MSFLGWKSLKFNQVYKRWVISVSDSPTNDKKTRVFQENISFKVLARVKCILLHYTKVQPKRLIRQKLLKDEFSKNNQVNSTKWQKLRTKMQSEIWNRLRFLFLIVVVKDCFAPKSIIFVISLYSTLICSITNLGWQS